MNKLLVIICFLILTTAAFCNEIEQNDEKILVNQINKIHAGAILIGSATTIFNVCAVTDVFLLTDLRSISSIVLSATLTCLSVGGLLGTLISGSVLLSSGIKKYKHSYMHLEKLQPFITKKLMKLKTSAIVSGIICSCSGGMALAGIGLICVSLFASVSNPTYGILGNIFTFVGSGSVFSTLPIMITSLAMSAWLKGQTNRLSVDIGLTSGNKGELSCDRSRRQQITPNGAAIALCVKF